MQSLRRACWRSLLQSREAAWGRRTFPQHRPFTQNRLLLLGRIPQRTQLPYLHARVRQGGQQFQIRFFRLFTIREPKTLREAGVTFIQVAIVFYTAFGLWKVAEWGITQETLERSQPTPHEYSWITRVRLREALGGEESGARGSTLPDWKTIGDKFVTAIQRLEDRTGDGKAIRGQLGEDEDIFVAGIGRTGGDVSACSEPWRRGYYQALMGAGRCAERLDGWALDRTRQFIIPEAYVVGPSNPNPQPMPSTVDAVAPREEDCDPAFEAPQKYYLKVITTRGFSVGQRLRAALAYADWLRYKGLNEAAQGMHTWAVDIALDGVDGERGNIIDNQTGVFRANTTTLTPNLLLAAESFGTHFALTGNMAAALPVFLSILRAQQNLPSTALPELPRDNTPISPYWEKFLGVVLPPKYPAAPPSGDQLLTQTPDTICASTSTMAHVGETLFASDLEALSIDPTQLSPDKGYAAGLSTPRSTSHHERAQPTPTQSAGLAWTRQAADVAEATLRSLSPSNAAEQYTARSQDSSTMTKAQRAERQRIHEQQKHCSACLTLALDNWMKMVERFERAEMQRQTHVRQRTSQPMDRAAQQQHAQGVRNMMAAAYRKDARPDDVLAQAEEAVKTSEAADHASEIPQPTKVTTRSSGGGWGMFWSSKLGLTPEPEETKAVTEGSAKGPWANEAAKVRARRYEARLLQRQLGLDD